MGSKPAARQSTTPMIAAAPTITATPIFTGKTGRISDDDLRQVAALAWRPAWSIRSRQGTFSLLVNWWRVRRMTGRRV
ncbi:MAG: hypothetical protein ACR2Q4_01970 [Geminicoccaceae bacterium]